MAEWLSPPFLPAATKLGQGNIFTSVCQEFCPQGEGGGCLPQCMLGYTPPGPGTPPWSRPPKAEPPRPGTPPGADTPPPDQAHHPPRTRHTTPPTRHTPTGADNPQTRHTPPWSRPPREADCSIRSTSGRYASYWNAFLFVAGIHKSPGIFCNRYLAFRGCFRIHSSCHFFLFNGLTWLSR